MKEVLLYVLIFPEKFFFNLAGYIYSLQQMTNFRMNLKHSHLFTKNVDVGN